jgi:hypothetical protein
MAYLAKIHVVDFWINQSLKNLAINVSGVTLASNSALRFLAAGDSSISTLSIVLQPAALEKLMRMIIIGSPG